MRAPLLLLAICLSLWPARPAAPHEIGETRLILDVEGAVWVLRITTAPTPLINRLELLAGQSPSRDLDRAKAERLLTLHLPALQDGLEIAFDGRPVAHRMQIERVAWPDDPLQPAFVVLTATGALPAAAQVLTLRFALVSSRHALQLENRIYWLDPDQPAQPLPLHPAAEQSGLALAWQYLTLGFTHILPAGPDHVLFVLGLVLLTTRIRPLLAQITAFTLAHCLTLALALEGVIALPARVVEPLIALSIAYVAIENLVTRRLTPWRPALVFAFGLLHGLGFAGVLAELGLPETNRILALVSFNLGIEAGQLSVVALAYGLVLYHFKDRIWYRTRLTNPASIAIALIGFYWTAQRVSGSLV